ncbi:MAG: sensor domain-containing diguanylate cyclase [Nitrospirales bacterium]
MNPELEAKLQACTTLPSPPKVAVDLIQLANNPEASIGEIAATLQMDPALSIKILRIANSPLYANKRKVETLTQATLIIGLNGILALALSFSLVKSLQNEKTQGLDHALYWRRSFIAASVSQAVGKQCHLHCLEELFMATLMQDIGMLALDRTIPKLYATETLNQAFHSQVCMHEQETIQTTHAAVGSWLLANWNLPERLQLAVNASDDPDRVPSTDGRAQFTQCVALSGLIAELYLTNAKGQAIIDVAERAKTWIGIISEEFAELFDNMGALISNIETQFEYDIHSHLDTDLILENAREALLIRNMQAYRQVETLQVNTVILESQFQSLEQSSRLDPLTGAFNRSYLDEVIETTFKTAMSNTSPLSFIFLDLDHFKDVNDTHGHQVGDEILRGVASRLKAELRATDTIGRYGGEEFVIVMPGVNGAVAETICNRIVLAFREKAYEVSLSNFLKVTVSLGVASLEEGQAFESAHEMTGAADQALYTSKTRGRDRWTAYRNLSAHQSSVKAVTKLS